jgi:hypothetical protein
MESVRTKAGYLPKDKETLVEELIPLHSQFYDIIREREDIYHEYVVKSKISEGIYKPYANHSSQRINLTSDLTGQQN